MRILTVHNRYLIRGGEDESREAEDRLLRSEGHIIDEYVLDNATIEKMGRLDIGLRTIWSTTAYREIRAKIQKFQPDIIDVHNFFPLVSPAVHYAAVAEGVPSVQTLHNYRLACLNGYFFRDGAVCEKCMDTLTPWPGVLHGCYRHDRLASLAVASMLVSHRLLGTWHRKVSMFVVLTEFARMKFIELGLPEEKLYLKPNFVSDSGAGRGDGGYALFVGRLSPEKGIDLLFDAWREGGMPPLKIVGDGPLTGRVQEAVQALPNVEYLGRRSVAEVLDLMGKAVVTVVPSVWYETFGRTVVESYSKGTPVIVSDIGAVGSIVRDGKTGFHFKPGNAGHLRERIQTFWRSSPETKLAFRQSARLEYQSRYTPEINYGFMEDIYSRARRNMGRTPN